MLIRNLFLAAVLGVLVAGAASAQDSSEFPLKTGAGIVQSLDYNGSSMIVSGYSYDVALDAKVEIGGTFGAFTMLKPGMKVRIDYLVKSASSREIVLIEEIPSGYRIPEV
ncbi:MAG: hypothetical protein R3E86_06835 [Pseudomonadales bacterium]